MFVFYSLYVIYCHLSVKRKYFMSNNAIYTQEQLDIALLKNNNEGILRTLSEIKSDMKSQWQWNLGLILGIYGLIGASAFVKVFGSF